MEMSDREHRAKVLAKCIHDGLSDKRSRPHYDKQSIAELIEAQMRPLEAAAREAGAAERDAAWRARIVEGSEGWWSVPETNSVHDLYEGPFKASEHRELGAALISLPLPDEEGDRDE